MEMKVLAVVGPTASGKSDLALGLAEALDGEIVNADAMQLYRGMDIGTAKTPREERRGIPHHLLDVLDVHQDASVAAYQAGSGTAIESILARGRTPILVGGSGLYVRAALDEMSFPPTDAALRAELEGRLEREGPGMLHDELTELDPGAAARIDRRNGRRVVRALEVVRLTGQPFGAFLPEAPAELRGSIRIAIDVDRADLADRIAERARRMFAGGLLEETAALRDRGLERGKTARRAVGYAQALRHLAGDLDLEAAVAETILATRQLARRQLTWFRRDQRVRWLPPGEDLAERVQELVPPRLGR